MVLFMFSFSCFGWGVVRGAWFVGARVDFVVVLLCLCSLVCLGISCW